MEGKESKKYQCKHVGCYKEYSSASARAIHHRKCSLPEHKHLSDCFQRHMNV